MTNLEKVKAWKAIEKALTYVQDPILRNTLRYEFQTRAIKDWGFCPAEFLITKDTKEEIPEMEDWEMSVYERMLGYINYGVDIRTEDEKRKLHNETLNNMCDFINRGGTYWEIPEDIRCDALKKIYDEAFEIVFAIK